MEVSMDATRAATFPSLVPSFPKTAFPIPFVPGVAAIEGAYMAQLLTFRAWETWLYVMEKNVKLEHDFLMYMLGYAPEEHEGPWDKLSRTHRKGWFGAMDKALAAAGE
jgi:hypothetical protein